ncbi:uncharacterized protein LOC108909353 [Anoplophora glabripennis]|uniref:uncharacterized protein LOC108909353 n=1 Tax=Anoplophora glabripennis TaxID=217634 RepID=UPI00087476A9|nr:uncharacterized protein LOC108909353 [Anoplophora glabripennis]
MERHEYKKIILTSKNKSENNRDAEIRRLDATKDHPPMSEDVDCAGACAALDAATPGAQLSEEIVPVCSEHDHCPHRGMCQVPPGLHLPTVRRSDHVTTPGFVRRSDHVTTPGF